MKFYLLEKPERQSCREGSRTNLKEKTILTETGKMVNIRSNNTINIAGRTGIEPVGMEKVQLKRKNSSVMLMEELVTIKGAEVRME